MNSLEQGPVFLFVLSVKLYALYSANIIIIIFIITLIHLQKQAMAPFRSVLSSLMTSSCSGTQVWWWTKFHDHLPPKNLKLEMPEFEPETLRLLAGPSQSAFLKSL